MLLKVWDKSINTINVPKLEPSPKLEHQQTTNIGQRRNVNKKHNSCANLSSFSFQCWFVSIFRAGLMTEQVLKDTFMQCVQCGNISRIIPSLIDDIHLVYVLKLYIYNT